MTRRAWGACIVLWTVAPQPALAEDPLPAARAQYEQHHERIEADFRLAQEAALTFYSNSFDRAAEMYQAEGDLESLLAVRKMQEDFSRKKMIPASIPSNAPERIRLACLQASRQWEDASSTRAESFEKLMSNYIGYLESLKRKLTTEGDLTGALGVRDEISRVQNAPARSAAQFEAAVSEVGESPTVDLRPASSAAVQPPPPKLAQEGPEAFYFRLAPWGGSSRALALNAKGDATLRGTEMQLRGGRIVLEGSEETIMTAFKFHNALTIETVVSAASINQTGPARIISSSKDGYLRNFSLCQEKDNLVFRLRTSRSDLNGMAPEVHLGKIGERTSHHLLISYRPGELVFYLDGEAKKVNSPKGDFSNWEAYPLLFGNELEAERPWQGSIRAVSVESCFVGREEAMQRYANMPGRKKELQSDLRFNESNNRKKIRRME